MRPPEPDRATATATATATAAATATATAARSVTTEDVLRALASVRDPELDEPLTTLGFVQGVEVTPARVEARLRLPTYFCAPNFAYLMVADAKAAIRQEVGAGVEVRVRLVDHFAAEEINSGVGCDAGFKGTFGDDTDADELEELRTLFRRKAYAMRQERLCRRLLRQGTSEDDLSGLTLADLPAWQETGEYLARRAELGLDTAGSAPFLLDADGHAVPPDVVGRHLRFARTVRVSIEGNAGFCRGLLQTRYGQAAREEATR
jgi:metal-sulfur cluster biosynthetic enzyme